MKELLSEWEKIEPSRIRASDLLLSEDDKQVFLDKEWIEIWDSSTTLIKSTVFAAVAEAIASHGWDWEIDCSQTTEPVEATEVSEKHESCYGCITIFSESRPEQFFDFADNPAEALLSAYLEALKSEIGDIAIADTPESTNKEIAP